MHSIKINAYAKINLTLYITGIRSDGYHELSTNMHSIDIRDEVSITRTDSGKISLVCNEDVPKGSDNTAVRAAHMMKQHLHTDDGFLINIKKNIPIQAGLGGSSADAAAVIRGINELYGSPMSHGEMIDVGAGIGADVPFMIYGGSAHCTGIGEVISPAERLPACFILLAIPWEGVPTKWAFEEFDKRHVPGQHDSTKINDALKQGNLNNIAALLHNDLEEVAAERFPEIARLKETMIESGALGAAMSGSGSGVFGIFDERDRLESAASGLDRRSLRKVLTLNA